MDKLHILLRIPEVNRLLEENNNQVSSIVGKNNTEEQLKRLSELDDKLPKEIDYVNLIVKEVLQHMKDKGWWVQGAGREEEGRDEERGRRQIREAIPPSVAASAAQSSMPESIGKS